MGLNKKKMLYKHKLFINFFKSRHAGSCTKCDGKAVFPVVGDCHVQSGGLLAFPHYRKTPVTSHLVQLLASLFKSCDKNTKER